MDWQIWRLARVGGVGFEFNDSYYGPVSISIEMDDKLSKQETQE